MQRDQRWEGSPKGAAVRKPGLSQKKRAGVKVKKMMRNEVQFVQVFCLRKQVKTLSEQNG